MVKNPSCNAGDAGLIPSDADVAGLELVHFENDDCREESNRKQIIAGGEQRGS